MISKVFKFYATQTKCLRRKSTPWQCISEAKRALTNSSEMVLAYLESTTIHCHTDLKALITITITIPSLNWPLPKWHVTMQTHNTLILTDLPSYQTPPPLPCLLLKKTLAMNLHVLVPKPWGACSRKFCCTYFFFFHADSYLPHACLCFTAKHLAVRPFLSHTHGNCSIPYIGTQSKVHHGVCPIRQ